MTRPNTTRARRFLRRLARATSGVAATEFALIIPFLLGTGLTGLEVGNRVMVEMKISQLAAQIADNASRIGDTSMLQNRKIYEADINDLLLGAETQGGRSLDLFAHGRVIISSQEVVPGTEDDQYIHWQRCMGSKVHASSFGVEGAGLSGSFAGMGPAGREAMAFEDDAVVFVEIAYDYQPIFGAPFGFEAEIVSTASYNVRDDRDLAGIHQIDPASPDPVADCAQFGGSRFTVSAAATGATSSSGSSGGSGSSGSSSSSTSSTSSTSGGSTSSTSGGTSSGSSSTSGGTTSSSGGRGGGGGRGGSSGGGRGGSTTTSTARTSGSTDPTIAQTVCGSSLRYYYATANSICNSDTWSDGGSADMNTQLTNFYCSPMMYGLEPETDAYCP